MGMKSSIKSIALLAIIGIFLGGTGNSLAQEVPVLTWAKGMAIDHNARTVTDINGNVYTTGSFIDIVDFDPGPGVFNLTSSVGNYDIYVSKLDANGNFVWARQMGGLPTWMMAVP
jgi:hypothetical protein